jgi:hypothetical protein
MKHPDPIAARNRENALHSTGPKTPEGRKRASLNAFKHGLTAQTVVLPTEDNSPYYSFVQSYVKDLKPIGMAELQIVQAIADDTWRLNRSRTVENNLFMIGLNDRYDKIDTEHEPVRQALAMADGIRENVKTLTALSMHQQRVSRQIERSFKLLRELQAERKRQEAQAKPMKQQDSPKSGSVFTAAETSVASKPNPEPETPLAAQNGVVEPPIAPPQA